MSRSIKSDESTKKKEGWTPDDYRNIAEVVRPLFEEWIQFQKDKEASLARRLDLVSHHNRRLSYSLIVFLLIIVGGMAILTLYGKVSGDALLFLVGTVTGYVVLMIQDLTRPFFEESTEGS